MNDIKVSVIIPVYNAEKYLKETLDSIFNQTFRDFEVIIINDGSTDASEKIIMEYREKISNMVCYRQGNSGVSSARNYALKYVKGKYVCFVDADDILHKDYLRILYNVASLGADVVFCEYDVFYNIKNLDKNDNIPIVKKEELFSKYSNRTFDYVMKLGYGISTCIKMYNADFLRKHNILFAEESKFGEDLFFNWKVFIASSCVYYIKHKLYFYRQSETSATLRYHPNLFESYARQYQNIREFADKNNFEKNQIEKSISENWVQRVPALLRMSIRQPVGFLKKINGVREIVNKQEIQTAIREYERQNNLTKELMAIRNRKILKVFYYGCVYEYRFRLVRFIRNWIKQ